jgi:Tfp pilus assembly protein FimT
MELVIAMGIVLVMTILAIPLVQNVSAYFKLQGAVASVSAAIQSTRYQAIFQGYPHQVVLSAAAKTIQIQNQPGGAGPFVNVCPAALNSCPIPLSGSGTPVTLDQDITLTFSPGGRVQLNYGAGSCPCTLIITYGSKPETITVSSYGNIKITP